MTDKHNHYFKDVRGLTHIDVYRVLQLFNVTDPCLQHAIKKLLVAGGRGVKDIDRDVNEAMDTLARWQFMQREDRDRFQDSKPTVAEIKPFEINSQFFRDAMQRSQSTGVN